MMLSSIRAAEDGQSGLQGEVVKYRAKPFYGWLIVAAGFIILFSLHGVIINTFGVFLKPVSESMGWDRATFSLALAIGAIAMAVGSPFVGKAIDSFGAPKTMVAGCVVCGLGIAAAGAATTLAHFYLVFSLVGIGLAAATTIPVSLVIANWFERRRGMAMGLAFTGTSVGGMVMNPVNTLLVQAFGWRSTYVILGVAMLLVTVPLALFIVKTRPSDVGLQPDGTDIAEEEFKKLTGHTLGQAVHTWSFWFIAMNMVLTNFMANAIGVHCYPYLTDIGHSEMMAGVAVGLSMGFMTLGKVGLGTWADRWGARRTFVLSAVMTAMGVWILMMATPFWVVMVFVFVYGFPQGGPLTLTPLVIADCHGLKNFGAIIGVLTLMSITGAAVGPVVVGKMYDVSGSYRGAFILLVIVTLLSAFCIHLARPSRIQQID
jgi:MFS family permease